MIIDATINITFKLTYNENQTKKIKPPRKK